LSPSPRLASGLLAAALLLLSPAKVSLGAEAKPDSAPVGFAEKLFIRTPGSEIVLLPGARLQVDGAFFPRQNPKSGVFLRRARVELAGWLGPFFYFNVSADFAPPPEGPPDSYAPSVLPATDNYLAFAPFGNQLILQVGQFDAPFTLENRTADPYTDFIERAMVARTLGAPRNKEVGAMVHGTLASLVYYSAGVFNGEGPGFRNVDNQPDGIGRVVVSPFGSTNGAFRRLSIGGSGWYGRHVLGPMFPVQATPGGVRFLAPRWVSGQNPGTTLELREHGRLMAAGGEVSLPLGTRFGLRGEGVWKRQRLAEADLSAPVGLPTIAGLATFEGIAAYGEAWAWLLGNERMLPAPGLQLPVRIVAHEPQRLGENGLMLALRGEILKEDLITNAPTLGNPTRATTRVISGTAGLTYWRGHLARFSVNYVANYWSGTSETIKTLGVSGKLQHEILVRFGMSL
jgi:hypothetical protein